ncbi:hypothetical protein [Pseudomonas sp. NPDC007930]|uniref:hypothetical protein n=1 Tax=Pseudomonas sp. NPDC007930 TaxID=3364417 RepID=UPI0036E2FD6D
MANGEDNKATPDVLRMLGVIDHLQEELSYLRQEVEALRLRQGRAVADPTARFSLRKPAGYLLEKGITSIPEGFDQLFADEIADDFRGGMR